MRRIVLMGLVAGLEAWAFPAMADEAVTYAGTLGKIAIIAEFIKPDAGPVRFGRYAYLAKGGDIPLHLTAAKSGLQIAEEAPCRAETCLGKDDVPLSKAVIGAHWTLDGRIGQPSLKGSWRADKGKTSLPIVLAIKGTRKARTVEALDYFTFDLADEPDADKDLAVAQWSAEAQPYVAAKMAFALTPGKDISLGKGRYRLDVDSRIGFEYPVVTVLPGADLARLNGLLGRLRAEAEDPAFDCLSQAYLGFDWSPATPVGSNGFDGNHSITVDHLTDRLMGITEGGSFFCGGAHPNNFENHVMIDVEAGRLVRPRDLVKGWVARDFDGNIVDPAAVGVDPDQIVWGPSDELVDYLEAHRQKGDDQMEADCGIPDLIRTNLTAYIKGEDLVFALSDLPHVIFTCTDDVLSLPLKDARPLLSEAGARYFEALD
ncbi:hypothetical protein [Rhizobium halophytocola]|uniref:DUF3298 domain-containing protein n=1 Tax=Rhizobium halophytocola TaxID=735519 RepID=A0ABS4DXE3_9HYPH|nr:hypothetical protein [Rhizobium halophytocola]MBP1850340.1 hypothetical protein [Rhizobium halophytocola]